MASEAAEEAATEITTYVVERMGKGEDVDLAELFERDSMPPFSVDLLVESSTAWVALTVELELHQMQRLTQGKQRW